MMQVVKFSRLVVSPVYGNCGPGDIVRCDEAFARHVVSDLQCAEYVQPVVKTVAAPQPSRRGRPRKEQSQ